MRFFETILFGASVVLAVTIDKYPESVVAGQTYTITYSPANGGPTTLLLRQGLSTDLTTVDTLTTSATGGSFQWTPSTSLVNEPDYALQIFQGDESNYSGQFPLTGGSEEAATSSAVSSAVSSAAYSASSMASSASASAASSASSAISSIEASVSSVLASITSAAASASITPSAGLNSTVTSATLSKSASASATTTKLPEVSTAAGNSLAQPMVAMLGAAAAFAYLA